MSTLRRPDTDAARASLVAEEQRPKRQIKSLSGKWRVIVLIGTGLKLVG